MNPLDLNKDLYSLGTGNMATTNYGQSGAILEQELEAIIGASNLVLELSKKFKIREFQLGDSVDIFKSSSSQNIQDQLNSGEFHFICEGRVRLLSFNPSKEREVSTQLLTATDTFGGDFLFTEVCTHYQAITASEVIIASISLEELSPFLAQLPELKAHWQKQSQERQKLIFWKIFTELHSLSSHHIKTLLPYLVEKQIPAGTFLAQADPGRFWLIRGEIQPKQLASGYSWGYPSTIPQDWFAQTDLLVYYLPEDSWQAATAIAPILANSLGLKTEKVESNGHKKQESIIAPTSLPLGLPRLRQRETPVAQVTPETKAKPKTESKSLDFPKPLKRNYRFWHSYPWIQQQSSSDCGAACLAMISQYWGRRLSLNYLRHLAGVGRSGASLKNLSKAGENLGYVASPVRASLDSIISNKNPWIAHWQGDHYIVVYQVKGNQVLVADPAKGKNRISRQEFLRGWTGYALLLEPSDSFYQLENEKRSLGKFINVIWNYRSLGVQIIFVSVLIQIFGLVSPLFTQIILDQIVVNKSQVVLNVFIIGAFLCGIWSISLSAVQQYLLTYLSIRLDLTMISAFIKHALSLPLKFFEDRRVGDILTRVQENQKIQRFLISQVLLAWLNFVTGFIYLGLMLYYNWQLTMLVFLLIPPIVILTLAATPFLRKISREVFNAVAEQNSALVEMITGVSTLKAAAAEQDLRWRWEDTLTKQLNVRFKGQKFGINLGVASGLINSIGGTALLWYGATLVIQDQLTIGQFVAFNMMKGYIISPVLALTNLWDELQEVLISVERLSDVFDTEPEESPQQQMLVLPPIKGAVKFEDVTFRYDGEQERNTLQNLNFEVKAGETIAIVGRSGSGKTTLVKLLQGLYFPTSGRICIDGHDIRHVSPQSLRSQLGVVPQECYLFSGTIFENISLYQPDFQLEQIIEVSKLAEAHGFVQSLPLGYNTKVGERGANLSGGQRQRISIARALLGNPRILVLDEATSSLDTESERRFQENLGRLARDRTTFIIAHRLSTVRNADCILVLDRGILVEQGNHEELIAQQGLYYHLAQQQLSL